MKWTKHIRTDAFKRGTVEWVCEHGVGHEDGVHGCCLPPCCGVTNYPGRFGLLTDIKNFEGRYAITTNGHVWSYLSNIWMKSHEKDRYLWLQLRTGEGTGYTYKSIHRLVAETFIPNPNNKRVINHKDANRQNNNVSNLEWATDSENLQDCYDGGRRPNQRETAINNQPKPKLSSMDIKDIKRAVSLGTSRYVLAKMYDVHYETIGRAVRRKDFPGRDEY